MKKTSRMTAIIVAGLFFMAPARASILDTEILLFLVGPVSEAVQETILLIRRGDNFISVDSLLIGCIAGGSAGVMVSLAPSLGFMTTGIITPVGIGYVIGSSILSCGMSLAGSAAGMFTSALLKELRNPPSKPLPPTNDTE